jgi:hypothetical protein
MRFSTKLCLAVGPLVLLGACEQSQPAEITPRSLALAAGRPSGGAAPSMSVFATGLLNPRGIAFGPDGALYVAEAGTGGTTSTVGQCVQDPNPSKSGPTGRISRIDAQGHATTVVSGLPSSVNTLTSVFGIADLAFVGPKLYGLLDAGCGHGVPNIPASVIQVANGQWSQAADLSAWVAANSVAHHGADVEPDGDWYSMIAVGGVLFAVDANGGQLVSVKPNSGKIDRVVDISATQGHIVPTAVLEGHGDFLVGNLETFPAVPGGAKVFRVTRDGRMTVAATNFTTILGLAYDRQGRLYVLESFTCAVGTQFGPPPCLPGPFAAGLGKVFRVNDDGSQELIASGLTFPTTIRLGPDGALYVSNKGYNQAPGTGEIVRIVVP